MPALQLLLLLFFTTVAVSHWIYSWVLLAPCLITGMVRSQAQNHCALSCVSDFRIRCSGRTHMLDCLHLDMLFVLRTRPMSGAQVQEHLPFHVVLGPAPDIYC